MHKTNKGFTLAEMVAAVGVLAVIAAFTIPTLITSTNKAAYVDGLKKAYLLLKTTTSALMANNGGTMIGLTPTSMNGDSTQIHNTTLDLYCSKLNCIKKCYVGTVSGNCFTPTSNVKELNGSSSLWYPISNLSGAVLANGMTFMLYLHSENDCDMNNVKLYNPASGAYDINACCGNLIIDINGFKPPNVFGRDIFVFRPHRQGIAPVGVSIPFSSPYSSYPDNCNPTTTNEYYAGLNCAGRVLIEGKMNY